MGGTGAGWTLRGGFPPGPGRGIQAFSRESPDAKSRGGIPPAPPFKARSLSLARFGVAGRSGTVVVFTCNHFRALIWELSFTKMLFSIFFLENASQIGLSIPKEIAPRPHQRKPTQKPASGNERLSKMGSRGLPLVFFPPPESAGNPRCRVYPAMVPTESPIDDRGSRPSFTPFLGRNGDPRRAGGATGRCAPRPGRAPPTPRVRSTLLPPHQGLENHPALWYDGINSVVTMERRALPCWAL